jgi:S1-C subfamily serine protease
MAEGTRTVMGSESKVSRVFHFTFRRCVGIAFSFAQVLSMCLSAQTAGAQAAPVGLSTETIAARAVPATVTIVTFGVDGDTIGMGSGFLVGPTGVIVTNFHVMAGASKAAVLLTNGERYEWVQALGTDATADLAILKIPGYGLPTLLTSPTLPPAGARLIAVGNPLGLSSTVTEGIVSAVRRFEDRQILQMSAAISVGSSGGPVLNGRGEVVAVATSFLRVGQNLNFAVPVRYAMGLLEAGGRPVTVAEAFASAGIDDPAPDALANGTAETRGRAQREGEQRAVMPRSSVVGAYAVSQETWVTHRGQAPTEPVEGSGLLLLGTHDNGFYVSIMVGILRNPIWACSR